MTVSRVCQLPHRARGVVLFVAMIALLVLSLLGVLCATTAQLETRMATDARERDLAELAALSALGEGVSSVRRVAATGAGAVCSVLRCAASAVPPSSAMTTSSEHALAAGTSPNAIAPPRWSVFDAGEAAPNRGLPRRHVYRVQAIGFGSGLRYAAQMQVTLEVPA